MSGKIIKLVSGKKEHACKGMPRFYERMRDHMIEGTLWKCDDCGQVWELDWYEGWYWVRASK